MKGLLLILMLPVFSAHAQQSFEKKISEAARTLLCDPPDEKHPVTLKAKLVIEKDSVAVIVKAALAPGWHVYQFVPSSLPYIPIEHVLQFPETLTAVGTWIRTDPMTSVDDPGVLIYEKEAVFIHKAVRKEAGKAKGFVRAGLYYQTCNLNQCLPPVEEVFELDMEKP